MNSGTWILATLLCFTAATALADDYQHEISAIAVNESGGGVYKNHRLVTTGINKGTRAGGSYGLMPLTVIDLIKKNPSLQRIYGWMLKLSPDQITNRLNTDPKLDRTLAMAFWKSLRKKMTPERAAYSWLNGPGRAKRATDVQIAKSEYVQNFEENLK